MFSFLRKNVLSRRGNLSSFKCSSSLVSIDSITQRSFSVSCGLPFEKTINVTNSEISSNPNSVISFFKNNGFSDSHISLITRSTPELLRYSVDKTLKPKFEFFKSQGITGFDLAKVLCTAPDVLTASLDQKIIPFFELMRSIVHTDANLLALLKRSNRVLREDPQKKILPNVALLRAQGVPADNIARLLVTQPRSFMKPTSRFSEILEEVKKMKFDPEKFVFLEAVIGLTCMSRSSLEAKFDVYRKWGLSKDEVQLMFRKNPRCMMISEENIMSTMKYFVNEMGYTPSLIAKQPNVLMYNLKRRIIPRCSVIQMLKGKGLVRDEGNLHALLALPEDVFLNKYVIKFEKEAPKVLSAYQGKGR